jgi:rhodanese-related sulfurtransferase
MKSVTPEELDKLLHDDDTDEVVIDVRTPAEYEGGHIDGAENTPLSTIDEAVDHLKSIGTVYVNCASGMRSTQACEKLSQYGINVVNLEGGLTAWEHAGKPIKGSGRRVLPVIRQVMVTAGSLVLLGIILGDIVGRVWYLLSAFVGAGLLFAGVTGFCGMAKVLSYMPWNKGGTCQQ